MTGKAGIREFFPAHGGTGPRRPFGSVARGVTRVRVLWTKVEEWHP